MFKTKAQAVINWAFGRLRSRFPLAYWIGVAPSLRGMVLEFTPEAGTSLCAGEAAVRLPCDGVIFPYVIGKSSWQQREISLLLDNVDRRRKYHLVDVGANIGLFSRQMLGLCAAIDKSFCFEPEPRNFALLEFNLRAFAGRTELFNFALGDANGCVDFYLDLANSGNYSINKDAVAGRRHRKITIQTRSSAELARTLLAEPGVRLIWKSDTQGHDELIATSFDDDFWQRVDVALMEIWRIDKREFDRDRLAAIVNGFSRRFFVSAPSVPLDAATILEYSAGRDGTSEDLILVR